MVGPDAVSILQRAEWVSAGPPPVRLIFRADGTGYYEWEGPPRTRPVKENFLFRLEDGALHLKFARAREWMQVATRLEEPGAPDDRLGRYQLVLERDPHAWKMEERPTGELRLDSDTGPTLPG